MTVGAKARILKATRMLQAKVGKGSVDTKAIEASQKIMDESDVDFVPIADEHLNTLKEVIRKAEQETDNTRTTIDYLIEPIMQIKANAAMFNYALVGELSTITLDFLENMQALDDDVLEIVKACSDSVTAIIAGRIEGDGGQEGEALQKELSDACKRYYLKMGIDEPSKSLSSY